MNITHWLSTKSKQPRMLQLDLLRGVAILLVLFTHSVVRPQEAGSMGPVLGYLQRLGPTGVDLFFVLSGFLVGGLLFRELLTTGRLDVRRFLIRRAFRIWPSYFVFLAGVFIWLLLFEHRSAADSVRALWPNLLHVQNYFGSPRAHTWSLAVEEHFYLALPLGLWLLTTRLQSRLPALPGIAAGLFVLCAVLRLQAFTSRPPYDPYVATHLRMDSLFLGVLLAYYHHFNPALLLLGGRFRLGLLCLGTALLLVFPAFAALGRGRLALSTLSPVFFYLCYGAFLLVAIQTPAGSGWLGRGWQGLPARGLAFVGYYSYPIYLWHIDATRPVLRLLDRVALGSLPPELRWLCAFATYVLVAVASGVVFGLLLEKPSLALRDRLFPARTRPAPGHEKGRLHPATVTSPDST